MRSEYSDKELAKLQKEMSEPEKRVIRHLEYEIAYDANSIGIETGLSSQDVVLIRKYFVKKGYAQLVHLKGYGGESPFLAGKGYILTELGLALKHYIWP